MGGRVTTPLRLQLGALVLCVPVVFFAIAIHVAVNRNDDTVQTVGEDATQGITIAQRLKLNLAELDHIAVGALLTPAASAETPAAGSESVAFPEAYNEQRAALHDNLVAAAAHSSGAAFEQTLVNIDYVLGHYHSLMAESFAASAAQDPATALERYAVAHQIMRDTLLPEADRFDKANTYVLNDSYGRQQERSDSTLRWITLAGAALVGALLAAQILMAYKFKRIVNVGLLAATVVTLAFGGFVWAGLEQSKDNLASARDDAFDAVHQLARARAVVVAAEQAQGHHLLDPTNAVVADEFEQQTRKVLRVPGADQAEIVEETRASRIPDDAAGFLAGVHRVTRDSGDRSLTLDAVGAFGELLAADEALRAQLAEGDSAAAIAAYTDGAGADGVAEALDTVQASQQRVFDDHVDEAQAATRGMGLLNLAVAAGLVALIGTGLYLRLREYST